MDGPLTHVCARDARARIALLVTADGALPTRLGDIELAPHQQAAVNRIEAAIREFGGALLADETGLGKTYVALVVARRAERPLVVAPAALRDMWHQAAAAAGMEIPVVSIEALSRRCVPPCESPDLVIVDEAHHVRTPGTARYRALAELTMRARVLLLSATPVHNSVGDLVALLALFLGARATRLDAAWMSRCIVRRTASDALAAGIPAIEPLRPLRIPHNEHHLDAILGLPPPVPPVDGGDGGTLLVYSLLRQWASTQGALIEALRRRLARAAALLSGLEVGRHPSTREMAAWSFADGAVQLAFPELMIDDAQGPASAMGLAECVQRHSAAVRALLNDLKNGHDPDVERAGHLGRLRSEHPGSKIVVFSQYAESVSAMFRLMRGAPGIAALTAAGGCVAGGTLTRAETLARFAPHAQRVAPISRAQRIDVLITTDLLSEGVNLQDAAVVVHLDLPWTPARLEQRVGRIARIGSVHDRVWVYAMLPPASAERIVRVEQRLRDKLRVSTHAVGIVGTILPGFALAGPSTEPHVVDDSPSRAAERIVGIVARWRDPTLAVSAEPTVAAVRSSVTGFVAVLTDASRPRLIADLGPGPSDDPGTVLAALRAAGGTDAEVDEGALAQARRAIARWQSDNRIRRDLSVDGALHARARRSVVDRIAAITRRAPRHLRPAITALAASARRTVTTRYGAGAERVLGELAAATMPDEAWLRAVSTFGAVHGATADSVALERHAVLVLILLSDVAPPDRET
jgi:hypothetical protein